MTNKIYAVMDLDAEQLDNHVITAPNDAVAMRIMKNSLRQDKLLAMNAEKYELICLGELTGGTTICNLEDIRKQLEPANE